MTSSGAPLRPASLIFAVSCSCLMFEISLLRTFSITLWYHFAFMVISIAMLGIGASGTALSLFPGLRDLRRAPLYTLFFAFSLPLSFAVSNAVPFDPTRIAWDTGQLVLIAAYYVVIAVPFFFFGTVVSTAYAAIPERSSAIYAGDLLGAGTGSIAVLLLLSLGGPEQAVLVAALLPLPVIIVSARRLRLPASILLAAIVLALLARPAVLDPRMSPYKPLPVALSFPGAELTGTHHRPYGRIDTFRSPAARFAPGLSLTYAGTLPPQSGIAVDGDSIESLTHTSERSDLRFLDYLPTALPYRLAVPDSVLVLDPGGGLAVLTARRFGSRSIDAVALNPLLLEILRNHDAGRDIETRYHEGLGRTWLSRKKLLFDVIDLPLSGTIGSSTFGFSEDYRFTVEAFRIYLKHLAPRGILTISHYLHLPPRAELRTLATLAAAAESVGIDNIMNRVIAVRSWDTVTILFSRSPFPPETVEQALRFCRERRFDTVYYHGMEPTEGNRYVIMPDDRYTDAFTAILDNRSRDAFLSAYLFDVRPVKDENPFSRYFLRLSNLVGIFEVMGGKWQFFFEEGYLLPMLFLQALLIVAVLLVAPLLRLRTVRRPPDRAAPQGWPWYFACLGLGYLFVEVAMIQTMVLTLEYPTYAAGTVIASLLIGSGAGGLALGRRPWLQRPQTLLLPGAATFLYMALSPLFPLLGNVILPLRTVLVFLLLLPAGFLMGMPFPMGMILLGKRSPEQIPWAWAVNGCFSVFAPILSVMIALGSGYRMVGSLGSLMYVTGYFLVRRWDGKRDTGTQEP